MTSPIGPPGDPLGRTFKIGCSGGFVGGGGPDLSVNCSGRVSADGDHLTLRSTAGGCKVIYATPSADGGSLDIRANEGASQSLSRVS